MDPKNSGVVKLPISKATVDCVHHIQTFLENFTGDIIKIRGIKSYILRAKPEFFLPEDQEPFYS